MDISVLRFKEFGLDTPEEVNEGIDLIATTFIKIRNEFLSDKIEFCRLRKLDFESRFGVFAGELAQKFEDFLHSRGKINDPT